jgi:Rps23 Pro-64 3,4-dihydroxylase Tpa1-like proline 4-hydroxylase
MNENYIDFIGVYKNVTPQGYCEHMIAEFNRLQQEGVGTNRQNCEGVAAHAKSDHAMFLDAGAASHFANFQEMPVLPPFHAATQACFNSYTDRFSILREDRITGTAAKFQKSTPGKGYHIWHGEQGSGQTAARVLAYMLYLNTFEPEEGGETEFLYQKLRIRPEENTMLVWPAAFTHAHRGNVVLGERPKFVITGWFYYD